MNIESFDNEEDVTPFLKDVTGYTYEFAVGTVRVWGHLENKEDADTKRGQLFYQIMPDGLDDGFFDWYCYLREHYQFFDSKEMAVAYFLRYWIIWNKKGKPTAEQEMSDQ